MYEQLPEAEYADGDTINDCKGNPITYTIQNNGRDQFINSMQCIKISEGNGTPPNNNQIIGNYTFSDINNNGRYNIHNLNSNVILKPALALTNTIEDNHFDTHKKVYDPYWMNYETDKTQNRIVSGDFDNDGYHDDIATFYAYGPTETRIHLFRSTGTSFNYSGSSGWWSSTGYLADKFTGRIVSGDFDNDGYHDDIATFYAYGPTETRIHLFRSTGTGFNYSGSSGWWSSTGYLADKFTGRIVSGDFDNDGYHDDIATFYAYGPTETRIHLFRSTGTGFNYSRSSGWWSSTGYLADKFTGRIVSGDFDNDGYHDDIATFYAYGPTETRIHLFRSTGTGFNYSGSSGWWSSTGYLADKFTGRIVSGDFDNDGYHDDIATFYAYGPTETRIHLFRSTGTGFNYSGSSGWWINTDYHCNQLTDRLFSGDFNENGILDGFVGFYSYGNKSSRTHIWSKTNGVDSFQYVNTSLGFPWLVEDDLSFMSRSFAELSGFSKKDIDTGSELNFKMYPNPVNTVLSIKYNHKYPPEEILLFSSNGKFIKTILLKDIEFNKNTIVIDISKIFFNKGSYLLRIKTTEGIFTKKLIVTM